LEAFTVTFLPTALNTISKSGSPRYLQANVDGCCSLIEAIPDAA
jgi:hypothetical protein